MITIQHIKTEAFNHFVSGETSLKVEPFIKKLEGKFDLSAFSQQDKLNLVHSALKSLDGICTCLAQDHYVLIKPISTYSQTIEIEGDMAVLISNVINTAVQRLRGDDSLTLTDPLNITSEDIHSLALMAQQTLQNYNPEVVSLLDEDDDEEDEDDGSDSNDLIPPFLKG
jgi:hypothetical protein